MFLKKFIFIFIVVFSKNVRKYIDSTKDQIKKKEAKIIFDALLNYLLHIIFYVNHIMFYCFMFFFLLFNKRNLKLNDITLFELVKISFLFGDTKVNLNNSIFVKKKLLYYDFVTINLYINLATMII